MKIHVRTYTFNPFQENTYLVYDNNKNAVIIDPGCYSQSEKEVLTDFIEKEQLKIHAILNTHCHIDHVFGNSYFSQKYQVDIITHRGELETLKMAGISAQMYGFNGYEESPIPEVFVEEGETITFGDISFKVIFAPGHSVAHIAFYNAENNILMGGDILFKGSFGRYDLPGGSLEVLKKSITTQIFTLPDNTTVYSGHGPNTTVGEEKNTNPILSY
jgi:glyoxylase-like metal-dependent hydrolase (beta-lactamase superfamily II)